jgi:hypothetical protein
VRWQYRDAGLLWLFVPAFAVHVAEEWVAGFPAWVARVAGAPLPAGAFVVVNGIAMAFLAFGVRAAVRDGRHGWIAVAVATIALVNTLGHAAGSVLTRAYSPGLVSAVVLYVPLASLTMMRALDQAPRAQLQRGIVAGLLIHALAFLVAWISARLGAGAFTPPGSGA